MNRTINFDIKAQKIVKYYYFFLVKASKKFKIKGLF